MFGYGVSLAKVKADLGEPLKLLEHFAKKKLLQNITLREWYEPSISDTLSNLKPYMEPSPRLQLSNFDIKGLISIGGCSKIWEASLEGERVVLKKCDEDLYTITIYSELNLLKKLQHKRIVGLLGAFYDNDAFLVLEFCVGSVNKFSPKEIGPRNFVRFAYQLLDGLRWIHGNNILHMDIKPDNLLITTSNNIVFTDFNISYQLKEEEAELANHKVIGTACFLDIEANRHQRFNKSTDIFSLGVAIYEMGTGGKLLLCYQRNFDNEDGTETGKEPVNEFYAKALQLGRIKEVTEDDITYTPLRTKGGQYLREPIVDRMRTRTQHFELLKYMVTIEQKNRLSAEQLLQNDYLKQLLRSYSLTKDNIDSDLVDNLAAIPKIKLDKKVKFETTKRRNMLTPSNNQWSLMSMYYDHKMEQEILKQDAISETSDALLNQVGWGTFLGKYSILTDEEQTLMALKLQTVLRTLDVQLPAEPNINLVTVEDNVGETETLGNVSKAPSTSKKAVASDKAAVSNVFDSVPEEVTPKKVMNPISGSSALKVQPSKQALVYIKFSEKNAADKVMNKMVQEQEVVSNIAQQDVKNVQIPEQVPDENQTVDLSRNIEIERDVVADCSTRNDEPAQTKSLTLARQQRSGTVDLATSSDEENQPPENAPRLQEPARKKVRMEEQTMGHDESVGQPVVEATKDNEPSDKPVIQIRHMWRKRFSAKLGKARESGEGAASGGKQNEENQQTEKNFKRRCGVCKLLITGKTNLYDHLKYTEKMKYVCRRCCDYATNKEEKFKKHMQVCKA